LKSTSHIQRQIGIPVHAVVAAAVLLCLCANTHAQQMKPWFEFKKPKMVSVAGDLSTDTQGALSAVFNSRGPYQQGFEGISQYDGASFGRNFVPPDTMGAVGRTQFMEVSNGAYAVFDKSTGARLSLVSDTNWWSVAGQSGTNGDTRVMYNADASRWMVVAFGADSKDLQIAISDTDNALGSWKSVKYEGYGGFGFGATADYPTLALDKNAVYVGTNNFAPDSLGGTNSFRGTTLNVIPLLSLFNNSTPSVAGMKKFVSAYPGTGVDRGFAPQGVNSRSAGSSGAVVAASLFNFDSLGYKVNGLTASSVAAATLGGIKYLGQAGFQTAGAGRQPDTVPDTDSNLSDTVTSNKRVADTLDERISSSVYEANGRIYMVNTVDSTADGLDEARVRYTVLDANTFAILSQGDIGSAGYDSYQGSIAVNSQGQVVIGYNRSGPSAQDGRIGFYARTFSTASNGSLLATSGEILLQTSLVDDYHNGTTDGFVANGRQRWGDYSQVSIDPSDESRFYLVGEFAREYNDGLLHPGGTGGSRWGTWIAVVSVPEPATYLMMLFGLGAMGRLARRRLVAPGTAAQAMG
jgi:hypothetical protein